MANNDYYISSPVQAQSRGSVLMLSAENVHDLEFFYPYYRLSEAGYQVDVVTPDGKEFKGKFGIPFKQVKNAKDVDATRYALLYIPGGKAPEALRKDEAILTLVKRFSENGTPVASICHGAQVLVSAGVVKGKRIAAWPEVESEITEAGGKFANEASVTDGQFITARWPGDLPAHLEAVLEALGASAQAAPRKVAGAR